MAAEALTVTIEKLVQGGRGLTHSDGQVLFVPGVIPGETVAVAMGARHHGAQEATVREVLKPAPERVPAPCPVYSECGGCQFQHIRYEDQLLHKVAILKETLARVGKLTVEAIPPVIPSPHPFGYRSTIRFTVFRDRNGFTLGFHRQGTDQPVAAACCLLVPEDLRPLVAEFHQRLGALTQLPLRLESVEIRRSLAQRATLLVYRVSHANRERAEKLFALFQNLPEVVGQVATTEKEGRWVQGQDWIGDRLDGLTFRLSDRSFLQAHWSLNESLSRLVREWVGPSPKTNGQATRVLELYCGIGTLGLPLARHGALVTEVEANPYALADARHAAKVNHIGRCRFRPIKAEAMLQNVNPGDYDVVLVDPPRMGLSRECLQGLLSLKVERILYLSCDPATLARDLGRLAGGGYRIARLQPIDMFPQTAHLETLVELVR